MPITLVAPDHPRTDQPSAPLPQPVLDDIAQGIARATSWWRPNAHHDPARRRPVRLLATAAYEVWVIGWTAGQSVELHDHGKSRGALVVMDGELAELALDIRTGAVRRTAIGAGTLHPLPVGLIHDIVSAKPAPATSIHVYSPPLTSMRRWDPVTLQPVATEPVHPEEPVLPAVAAGQLLHPSSSGSRAERRGDEASNAAVPPTTPVGRAFSR